MAQKKRPTWSAAYAGVRACWV